jgi:hypothetical protein
MPRLLRLGVSGLHHHGNATNTAGDRPKSIYCVGLLNAQSTSILKFSKTINKRLGTKMPVQVTRNP